MATAKPKREYIVDATYQPTTSADICYEFIENYCYEKKQMKWLVDTLQKSIVDKNGKTRSYPFVNLRADFVNKFFPDIVAPQKPSETMLERALKRAKEK